MKKNLGQSNLEELRKSSERQRLCNMYFKFKQQEFKESKTSRDQQPFDYSGSNQTQNMVENELSAPDVMNGSSNRLKQEIPQPVKTQSKSKPRSTKNSSTRETLKRGINYSACIDILNKIQKSVKPGAKRNQNRCKSK